MRRLTVQFLILLLFASGESSFAQPDSTYAKYNIAVFTPLYLDSAFDAAGNYRYGKQFPKFINPGLEFFEGVQLAADTLSKEGVPVDIHIYDTRSATMKLEQLVSSAEMEKMDLLIGHVTVNEAAQLARAAATLQVPFININLPNDAGVTGNPNYVLLNSTLMTHCTGIYRFIQRNYALSPIVMFTKKGVQEDRLRANIAQVEKTTASVPLKIKIVTLPDSIRAKQLVKHFDTTKNTVIIAGSLDANFGQTLCQELAIASKSYKTTIIGMPTWDLIDFNKPFYRGINVVYSTPFYINQTDKLAIAVHEYFKNKFYSRPSDMVFRGYETIYHFAHMLEQHGDSVSFNLADRKFKLFHETDIQPVINKQNAATDYYENKKLYFIKKTDGVIKGIY